MQRDPRVFLWDVREAADDIAQFLAGLDIDAYERNKLVRAAVERKFEVIGEALNLLSRHAPDWAQRIKDLRRIVDFRNVLIHGYATVNDEHVWRIAHESLPGLRETVAAMLDELGPPEA